MTKPNVLPKFIRHDSADELVALFFSDAMAEFGETALSEVGVEGFDGESVSGPDMLAGIKAQRVWGFSDTNKREIHWWADDAAEPALVAHMLGHEMAHLVDPQTEYEADELHAEVIGKAMAAVYAELAASRTPLVARLVDALDHAKAALWDAYYGHGIELSYVRNVDAMIRAASDGCPKCHKPITTTDESGIVWTCCHCGWRGEFQPAPVLDLGRVAEALQSVVGSRVDGHDDGPGAKILLDNCEWDAVVAALASVQEVTK